MKNNVIEYSEITNNEQTCNNGSLYLLLYEFERSIRSFIVFKAKQHLEVHYNDNWEHEFYSKISSGLLKDISKACEREKDIAIYTGMNIDYKKEDFLNFSFISEAVLAWWDQIFAQYFKHQQYFKTDIDKVKNVRNALSHFRQTTIDSQLETFSICKRLLTIVYGNMPANIYKTTTNLEELLEIEQQISSDENSFYDIHKVYIARSDVQQDVRRLIKQSKKVEAIGISINELTMKMGDRDYYRLLEKGTVFILLMLDPEGKNVSIREEEENVEEGHIADATRKNLYRMNRLKKELKLDGKEKLFEQIDIILYDEVPRLNLMFIDEKYLFVQYYANSVKGANNPTFYIENDGSDSIYSFYRKVYNRTLQKYKSKVDEK